MVFVIPELQRTVYDSIARRCLILRVISAEMVGALPAGDYREETFY